MAGFTPADVVKQLTKPGGFPGAPQISTRSIKLFKDANWESHSRTYNMDDYKPGARQTVESDMFDVATLVLYNLPIGVVVTLMDNVAPVKKGAPPADLSNCGRCVDLVGTGETVSLDLGDVNMNDCVSSWFWRDVDLSLGAIELFEDANYTGNYATVFLSEWTPTDVHSIAEWYLQDRISSVRWRSLFDRQDATLYKDVGGGDTYDNSE